MSVTLAKPTRALVALLLLWTAALQGAERGVLYRLEKPGQPDHYLMGTMHSDDPRVLALLDRVGTRLESVDQVVLEILPDAAAMIQVSLAMLLPPGAHLSQLVGDRLFREVESALAERGLPVLAAPRLKPWAAAVMLATPDMEGDPLDQRIYRKALALGKKVHGLERPAEQMAYFDELSPDLQKRLLEETLAQLDGFETRLEQLKKAYLEGDLHRLQRLSLEIDAAGDEALAAWFRERLIDRRNRIMLERLLPLLEANATFVAVGALHLPGNDGLIKLLRNAGYRVTPLF